MKELTAISDRATEILEIVNTVYRDTGISLPERQYVTIGGLGTSVHDCPQVTVSFGSLDPSVSVSQPINNACMDAFSATFVIEIVRCATPIAAEGATPAGGRRGSKPLIPSAESLGLYGVDRMKDAVLLHEVAKAITEDYPVIGEVNYALGFTEASDMQGVTLTISVTV